MRGYVFGHSSFAGKTGISIEERQKGANSQWPEMAISSVPKRQTLLLSRQTDIVVNVGAHTHKEEAIFVFCSVAYLCPK
jgi:hypothetical protein